MTVVVTAFRFSVLAKTRITNYPAGEFLIERGNKSLHGRRMFIHITTTTTPISSCTMVFGADAVFPIVVQVVWLVAG